MGNTKVGMQTPSITHMLLVPSTDAGLTGKYHRLTTAWSK